MNTSVTALLKKACIGHMQESLERIRKCMDLVTEEEAWQRPNANLSSIANLVLHLGGNIRQYAISSLGGQPDHRQRSAEFSANGGYDKASLLKILETTITDAFATIIATTDEELVRVRQVQGFTMSGVEIIIHVTEHLSYHTGQISFRTKQLRGTDLQYYGNTDLDAHNET